MQKANSPISTLIFKDLNLYFVGEKGEAKTCCCSAFRLIQLNSYKILKRPLISMAIIIYKTSEGPYI